MDKTVLVVDDSADYRMLVCLNLKKMGFNTLSAADGREGFAILEENPDIRIVLTDIHMPVEDGFCLLHRVRRLTRHVRVLLMSGDVSREQLDRCSDRPDGFFQKPINLAELADVLRMAPKSLH